MRRQDNLLLLPRVGCAYASVRVMHEIDSQCTASKEAVSDISVIVNCKNVQKILLNLCFLFKGGPEDTKMSSTFVGIFLAYML